MCIRDSLWPSLAVISPMIPTATVKAPQQDCSVCIPRPVSYTHLDVYKRQRFLRFMVGVVLVVVRKGHKAPFEVVHQDVTEPVSYTHLDVYKRHGTCLLSDAVAGVAPSAEFAFCV